MVGQRFGKLVALKDLGKIRLSNGKFARYMFCVCDCCSFTEVLVDNLKRGLSKSCGYCVKFKPECNNGLRLAYAHKKKSAKRDSIPFHLTFEQYKELILGDCHYCKATPKQRKLNYKADTITFLAQESLDRKNPYGEYSVDNCVPCCLSCNHKKQDMPYEIFMQHIRFNEYVRQLGS